MIMNIYEVLLYLGCLQLQELPDDLSELFEPQVPKRTKHPEGDCLLNQSVTHAQLCLPREARKSKSNLDWIQKVTQNQALD